MTAVTAVNLQVGRWLDERMVGRPDLDNKFSPAALALHHLRQRALHEILIPDAGIEVKDWGLTDDEMAHERVHLLLYLNDIAQQLGPLTPVLAWAGGVLTKSLGDAASSAILALAKRLRRKQETHEIHNFVISQGDKVLLQVDPPSAGRMALKLTDGRVVFVDFNTSEEEMKVLGLIS